MKLLIGKNEIELLEITQLCGTNFKNKKYIVDSICKHFSGYKYAEYESKYINNIKLENDEIGRKYFDAVRIKDVNDLVSELKISKASAIMQWINFQLEDIQYRYEMENISDKLEVIYDKINELLKSKDMEIKVLFEQKNIFEILLKSFVATENEYPLETKEAYELLDIYLKVIFELQINNSQKKIVIIENIDHMVSVEQYNKLYGFMKSIVSNSNIFFIVTTSVDGYVYIDKEYIKGINVINDEVFTLPDYEHLYSFLIDNYPCQQILNEVDVINKIRSIVHKIGNIQHYLDLESDVFLKLINSTLGINTSCKKEINQLELAFLCS